MDQQKLIILVAEVIYKEESSKQMFTALDDEKD